MIHVDLQILGRYPAPLPKRKPVVKDSLTAQVTTSEVRLTVLKNRRNRYSIGTLPRSGQLRKITLTYCHVNTFILSSLW